MLRLSQTSMSLKELLKDKLPEEKLQSLPKGFEIIGGIAIISIPPSLDDEKYLVAQALVSHRKDVNVVLRKTSKLNGARRIGEFEILMGDRTTTLHRENGCIFYVDVAKTYFSGKHFYTFKKDFELSHFKKVLEDRGWTIDFYRNCGGVAPRVKRYVFDLLKI